MSDTTETKPATVSEVFAYFSDNKTNDLKLGQFSAEWKELDSVSKEQIRNGIGDGSFNY